MKQSPHDWTILLAGGSGTRLCGWAGPDDGAHIPKPYRRLVHEEALIDQAVARARHLGPACRLVLVVSAEHESWWRPRRPQIPGVTWLVQRDNRGTGGAILSALSFLLIKDPEAAFTLMPVDQAIDDEENFLAGIRQGREALTRHPERTILLGSGDDGVDDGYGWIVPGETLEPGLRGVTRFVGRAEPEEAGILRRSGALVDTFLLVGAARTLMAQFRRASPELIERYLSTLLDVGPAPDSLMRRQAALPILDFGRWFLEPAAARGELAVATLPPCGWADIGTPERVEAWLDRHQSVRAGVEALEVPGRGGSGWPSRRH
ncbi:MAG: NTP transferase domain-containing protein [Candidatus Eisenbacteria bacterium]|nr:NTP transferase domain-containing protein [Candidatus Eisenbacteria bacterium]